MPRRHFVGLTHRHRSPFSTVMTCCSLWSYSIIDPLANFRNVSIVWWVWWTSVIGAIKCPLWFIVSRYNPKLFRMTCSIIHTAHSLIFLFELYIINKIIFLFVINKNTKNKFFILKCHYSLLYYTIVYQNLNDITYQCQIRWKQPTKITVYERPKNKNH